MFLHILLPAKTPSRNTKIWQAHICLHYFWPSWNQETLEISQSQLCLTDYPATRFCCCYPTEYNSCTHQFIINFPQISVINKFPRLSDISTPHFYSIVAAYYIAALYPFYAPSHWVTGVVAWRQNVSCGTWQQTKAHRNKDNKPGIRTLCFILGLWLI